MPKRAGSKRPATERAFTLIEVLVAGSLLAVLLLAIGTTFVLGGRQIRSGRNISQATALAQHTMETLGSRSYTALYTSLGAGAFDSHKAISSAEPGFPIDAWRSDLATGLDEVAERVTIEALGPGQPAFGDAAGIRLTVETCWNEAGNARCVLLRSVRF